MTSAEDYAQKRAAAVELIRRHAPPRLQDALIELLRPAIARSSCRRLLLIPFNPQLAKILSEHASCH